MEFAPERVTKGTARQVHESDCASTPPDGDLIVGGKLADDLAIDAQDDGDSGANHLHIQGRGQRQN